MDRDPKINWGVKFDIKTFAKVKSEKKIWKTKGENVVMLINEDSARVKLVFVNVHKLDNPITLSTYIFWKYIKEQLFISVNSMVIFFFF